MTCKINTLCKYAAVPDQKKFCMFVINMLSGRWRNWPHVGVFVTYTGILQIICTEGLKCGDFGVVVFWFVCFLKSL